MNLTAKIESDQTKTELAIKLLFYSKFVGHVVPPLIEQLKVGGQLIMQRGLPMRHGSSPFFVSHGFRLPKVF